MKSRSSFSSASTLGIGVKSMGRLRSAFGRGARGTVERGGPRGRLVDRRRQAAGLVSVAQVVIDVEGKLRRLPCARVPVREAWVTAGHHQGRPGRRRPGRRAARARARRGGGRGGRGGGGRVGAGRGGAGRAAGRRTAQSTSCSPGRGSSRSSRTP